MAASNLLFCIYAICICTQDKIEVMYSNISENQLDKGETSIFVAAFTSCHTHLKLYKCLEKLKEKALHFNTHSVSYFWCPSRINILLSNFLGNMTNELGDGDHITEFTLAGLKNLWVQDKQW